MRNIIFVLFAISFSLSVRGQINDSTIASQNEGTVTTLSDIIAMESRSKVYADRKADWWRRTNYLNILYNKTKLRSDILPLESGTNQVEFYNKYGLGIQWGNTYYLHRIRINNVLFFGLDFTWLDLNINKYRMSEAPLSFPENPQGITMPWHHEKLTYDYGMSAGPSIFLYPFDGIDISLNTYFHIGYCVAGLSVKDVQDKTERAFGHGLFYSIGASLSLSRIGLGYELRNDNNFKFRPINENLGTGYVKFKQQASRFYIQYRF